MVAKKDTKGRRLYENEDQMKDGRYRYRYTDSLGKRRAVYSWRLTTTDKYPQGKKKDLSLREKEKDIQKDLADGIKSFKKNITVAELIEKYLSINKSWAKTTEVTYINAFNKIKESDLSGIPISSIQHSDILEYYSDLSTKQELSFSRINVFHTVLYGSFNLALKDGLIRSNPCNDALKIIDKKAKHSREALLIDKQDLFMRVLKDGIFYKSDKETNYQIYVMASIMLYAGLRVGEIAALTWKDFDFEENYIFVTKQIQYIKNETGSIKYITKPKWNECRKIPLFKNLAQIIKEYREYSSKKFSGVSLNGVSGFLFVNKESDTFIPSTISRHLRNRCNTYNKNETILAESENREPILLPCVSSHILRHTFCTRMAENNMDLKVLQVIMGHKDISTTMKIYNHAHDERVQGEFKKLKDFTVFNPENFNPIFNPIN